VRLDGSSKCAPQAARRPALHSKKKIVCIRPLPVAPKRQAALALLSVLGSQTHWSAKNIRFATIFAYFLSSFLLWWSLFRRTLMRNLLILERCKVIYVIFR
jgi:hypothetical protein